VDGLPDEAGPKNIFEHYYREFGLVPGLAPGRLAAELASAAQGLTGSDIAFVCSRAMFCVKDAVGANDPKRVAERWPHRAAVTLP
jgi:hypothetical protein